LYFKDSDVDPNLQHADRKRHALPGKTMVCSFGMLNRNQDFRSPPDAVKLKGANPASLFCGISWQRNWPAQNETNTVQVGTKGAAFAGLDPRKPQHVAN
jgi:hypothetical protein